MHIVESNDDVHVDEITAPEAFARESYEFMTFEDCGITAAELPRPVTWRVLIMPKQPRQISKGGIVIPQAAQAVENHLNYIGQIVAMGPLAGKNERFLNPDWQHWDEIVKISAGQVGTIGLADALKALQGIEPPKYLYAPKVGDWVIYGKYSGMGKMFKGVKFVTVNDDEITDVIDGPNGFTVYL